MAFGLFKKKKEENQQQNSHYLKLKVKEVVRETSDAISIHFEQPADGDIQYRSGQFFTLILDINGKKERRAYSLCSSPYVDAHPAVTVKRVQGGLVSNHLNDHIKAGDEMEVMEPMGVFTTAFDHSNKRHLVLFGGGSGITPLISIAKSALHKEPDSKVSLVYANRNQGSIIFEKQLEEMEARNKDKFKVVHVLGDAPREWEGYTGLLNESIIKGALEQLPQMAEGQTEYFMCGPGPMMDVVTEALNNFGIDQKRVHKESFTSSSSTEVKPKKKEDISDEIVTREVTVIYDGEEHKFEVEPSETILEKGLELDIDLPFSCQSGLCTACRGKCVSGKVKLDEEEGLSEAEIEEGYVLTCVGHPLTDDVVIEIG